MDPNHRYQVFYKVNYKTIKHLQELAHKLAEDVVDALQLRVAPRGVVPRQDLPAGRRGEGQTFLLSIRSQGVVPLQDLPAGWRVVGRSLIELAQPYAATATAAKQPQGDQYGSREGGTQGLPWGSAGPARDHQAGSAGVARHIPAAARRTQGAHRARALEGGGAAAPLRLQLVRRGAQHLLHQLRPLLQGGRVFGCLFSFGGWFQGMKCLARMQGDR